MANAAKMNRKNKPATQEHAEETGYIQQNPFADAGARFEIWDSKRRRSAAPTREAAVVTANSLRLPVTN
jgi:hypothetical protein